VRIHRSASDHDGPRYRNELLQDDRLSLAGLGLLVKLLNKPDGWSSTADDISREARQHRGEKYGEGRKAIRTLFAELERCGYLVRKRTHDAQGRFVTLLEIHDTPQPVVIVPEPPNTAASEYPRGEYLYRHWDTDGRLLYVGIAANPGQRERRHAKSSRWMEFQAEMTVERFETRREAEDAEAVAIANEQPIFNMAANDTLEARERLTAYLTEQGRTDLLAPAASRG
jgi:hypothetical protein